MRRPLRVHIIAELLADGEGGRLEAVGRGGDLETVGDAAGLGADERCDEAVEGAARARVVRRVILVYD